MRAWERMGGKGLEGEGERRGEWGDGGRGRYLVYGARVYRPVLHS